VQSAFLLFLFFGASSWAQPLFRRSEGSRARVRPPVSEGWRRSLTGWSTPVFGTTPS